MKRVKIEIEGMSCHNCEGHVLQELRKVGARNVRVSHVEKAAICSVDDKINEEILKRAVKTAGYIPGKIFFKEVEKKNLFGRFIR